MMHVKIEGRDGLVRDMSSGAILNVNRSEYENYLAKKKRAQSDREKLAAQEAEINNLRSELAELKQLITTVLNKQHG